MAASFKACVLHLDYIKPRAIRAEGFLRIQGLRVRTFRGKSAHAGSPM